MDGQSTVKGDVTGHDKISPARDAYVNSQVTINNPPPPTYLPLHQLPAPPADFTGRTDDLAELRQRLGEGGAVISGLRMHGQGGVGKTALALKLASELKDQYPDAQFYLDLQGAGNNALEPIEIIRRIIRAYHPEAQLPESLRDLRNIYTDSLSGQRALLLLDNASDAAQVMPLTPPAGCLLLVTSRQVFALPGLYAKSLDILPPTDSNDLIARIAPRLAGDQESLSKIASLCGYLPFALRAAASLFAVRADLDPRDYVKQLADEQERLRLSITTVDSGEVSLEASFNLSYLTLPPEMARVFRSLAVFPASFDAVAEEIIAQDPDHLRLSDLLQWSLVQYDVQTKRYRLHDLTRTFAGTRLIGDERHAAEQRHTSYFLQVLALTDNLYLKGGDSILLALRLFDLERGNIETGQAWAQDHTATEAEAARLCSQYYDAGVYVLSLRYHVRDQIRWLEASLTANRKIGDWQGEGSVLGNLGNAYLNLGKVRQAIEFYEQTLVIVRKFGDRFNEGNVLGNLGNAYRSLAEVRRAIEFYEQQLVIVREIGDRRGEGNALSNLGNAYRNLGEVRQAIDFYEQRLEIAREIGDRVGESITLGNLGIAYFSLKEVQRAIDFYEQQLVIVREIGDRHGEGNALGNLGNVYRNLGEAQQAIEFYEQALIIMREVGDPHGEGSALGNLGNAYRNLGEARKAIEFYEQQLVIAREISDRRGEGNALANSSLAFNMLGERARAISLAEAALKIYIQIEDPNSEKIRLRLIKWRDENKDL